MPPVSFAREGRVPAEPPTSETAHIPARNLALPDCFTHFNPAGRCLPRSLAAWYPQRAGRPLRQPWLLSAVDSVGLGFCGLRIPSQ